MQRVAELYTDQMIRSLARFDGVDDFRPPNTKHLNPLKRAAATALMSALRASGVEAMCRVKFDCHARTVGLDHPVHADTMIGLKRLQNLRDCVRTVIAENIPGDLIETGVWRGGASILMKACLEAYGDTQRTVWCADSFEGLPPPNTEKYPQDAGMNWNLDTHLAISMDEVKSRFDKYGLLDERVRFLKGWFKDTLPMAPIKQLAILRMDGDLYESTMDALNNLYDKVSPGGFIIVDDYGMPQDCCRQAVSDFRSLHQVSVPIVDIDGTGVFWRKP